MSLEVSVARECRYETDRWILGYCWLPLAIGTWVLEAFVGGEILSVYIPTLVPLVFLLSLDCPCLCYDEIKSEHAYSRHTRWEGRESM